MKHTITPATSADYESIDKLLRVAFPGPEEAGLVRKLRKSGEMVLELVARAPEVVGHIAVSKMVAPIGWLGLAPLAVLPEAQRQGIGTDLTQAAVRYAIDELKSPICVLGRVEFYEKCGFSQARAAKMRSPYPVEFTMLAGPGEETPEVELIYPSAFDGV